MFGYIIFLLSSFANAETLVVLHGPDGKTEEIMEKVSPSAEFVNWADLQDLTLTFGAVPEV